tara:strand:+ start:3366 stop:3770 length:405 start_codon:yes stop_codon:yes gene_type:complete
LGCAFKRRETLRWQRRKKVDAEGRAHQEWQDYFNHIRSVCPWAYVDFHAGKIDIVETSVPQDLGNYSARIYEVDIHSHDLRAYSEYLNETRDDEWFYSDPAQGEYSSPVSILIQQDPERLNKIRQKTGTFNSKT